MHAVALALVASLLAATPQVGDADNGQLEPIPEVPSDAPVAVNVERGTIEAMTEKGLQMVSVPPGVYMNDLQAQEITAKFNALLRQRAALTAENESLKAQTDQVVKDANAANDQRLLVLGAGIAAALLAGALAGHLLWK